MTTIVHHSADYDGIFCREVAKKFLPGAHVIGWDFADKKFPFPFEGMVYVLDLSPDCFDTGVDATRLIWIDHHKSAIEKWPPNLLGYRIDGVAACRLAWQWFSREKDEGKDSFGVAYDLPQKKHFVDRVVGEPLSIRLAGEYDIWDHRGDGDIEFQFGLDSQETIYWDRLFEDDDYAVAIAHDGGAAMQCYKKRDADIMRARSFLVDFRGLKFLALNTARCNSNTFSERDRPETGHDALMGFYFDGKMWNVSLYHASHRTDIDLSEIAVSHNGGGHRGACGFRCERLPFQT